MAGIKVGHHLPSFPTKPGELSIATQQHPMNHAGRVDPKSASPVLDPNWN